MENTKLTNEQVYKMSAIDRSQYICDMLAKLQDATDIKTSDVRDIARSILKCYVVESGESIPENFSVESIEDDDLVYADHYALVSSLNNLSDSVKKINGDPSIAKKIEDVISSMKDQSTKLVNLIEDFNNDRVKKFNEKVEQFSSRLEKLSKSEKVSDSVSRVKKIADEILS